MKRLITSSTSTYVFDLIDRDIKRALRDCAYKAYAQLVEESEEFGQPHPGDQNDFIWDLLHDDNVWNLRKDFTAAIHRAVEDHMKKRKEQ